MMIRLDRDLSLLIRREDADWNSRLLEYSLAASLAMNHANVEEIARINTKKREIYDFVSLFPDEELHFALYASAFRNVLTFISFHLFHRFIIYLFLASASCNVKIEKHIELSADHIQTRLGVFALDPKIDANMIVIIFTVMI